MVYQTFPPVPLSVLDLSPILEGGNAAQAFRNTLDLAQHAERWGYNRYWLAEHHNMPGIASAATAVVIGHVAGGTSTIRVGAGGIMRLTAMERAAIEQALSCSVVGSPEMVRQGLEAFVERTAADELMVVSQIYDHAARLRSYEIAAGGAPSPSRR